LNIQPHGNENHKDDIKKINNTNAAEGKENEGKKESKIWAGWGLKPTWPSWRTLPKDRKPVS